MASPRIIRITAACLSGMLPVILYLSNATHSLGFADAAEFALVTKLLSTAHPPGFPAYVLSGHLFSELFAAMAGSHVWAMVWFSALCSGVAGLLLFLSTELLIRETYPETPGISWIAFLTAAGWSYGTTVWYWSNNVEVYAFHAAAVSLAIYGMLRCRNGYEQKGALLCGTGIGLALCTHHLTMVLLLPFLCLLAYPGLLQKISSKSPAAPQRKKSVKSVPFRWLPIPKTISTAALTAGIICVAFYSWMFVRAGQDFVFEFGNPDNLSRLIYHLAGGAWMKTTAQEVKGIVGMRFPYFMGLVWWQFTLFLIFILWALFLFTKNGMKRFVVYAAGYFLVILIYQLRIDQTSDTDAYLIPAFLVLAPLAGVGMAAWMVKKQTVLYVLPVLGVVHACAGFYRTDKRNFDVSESLMKMLDESAPKGAVILISDWTLVIQYYYYRIAENFRPDLTVLNYDLKFTNYKSIPLLYPDFYRETAPSYDEFVKQLGAAHPQEIYNTGCTLDTPELMASYKSAVMAIQEYCRQHQRMYMVDPKAFVFQIQNGMMTTSSRVSGMFVSQTETGLGERFLDLPFRWLDSPITLTEPAATDKLVDFEAMLDFHRNYYRSSGDSLRLQKAEASYLRIKTLQRKVKKHLPFVFRKD